jgi:hypothetical protein
VKDGPTLLDLWKSSPVAIPQGPHRAEEFVDALFPGNPLLCVGQSDKSFGTHPREEWRGRLDVRQLIVPSPMSAVMGQTKKGHMSAHTLDNTVRAAS